jgi:hypothetical protein
LTGNAAIGNFDVRYHVGFVKVLETMERRHRRCNPIAVPAPTLTRRAE